MVLYTSDDLKCLVLVQNKDGSFKIVAPIALMQFGFHSCFFTHDFPVPLRLAKYASIRHRMVTGVSTCFSTINVLYLAWSTQHLCLASINYIIKKNEQLSTLCYTENLLHQKWKDRFRHPPSSTSHSAWCRELVTWTDCLTKPKHWCFNIKGKTTSEKPFCK